MHLRRSLQCGPVSRTNHTSRNVQESTLYSKATLPHNRTRPIAEGLHTTMLAATHKLDLDNPKFEDGLTVVQLPWKTSCMTSAGKLRQSYVIGRVFSPLASAEGHLRNSDRYATAAVAPGLCGFTARVPVVDLVFGDSGLARNGTCS